ncbi:MAG: DUF481 domain-containing protein [Thalassotalea sp.]|nr:DUF481 domain-containing protein [Thalassotalea sp.]
MYKVFKLSKVLFALLILSSSVALAAEEQKVMEGQVDTTSEEAHVDPWQVNVPHVPRDYDWLLLKNGELFKGEVQTMYQESMEFDSDEVGVISIDMDDIAQLRGKQIMSIRFEDDSVVEGRMVLSNNTVSFVEHPGKTFPRKNILAIAPSEASGESLWSGEISLGINYKDGNTEKFDYSSQLKLRRLTAVDRIYINLIANYSATKDAETKEKLKTIENRRFTASYDWFFSRRVFFRIPSFEYYSDEFKNIDYQLTLGVAIGYVMADKADFTWDVHTGPSVLYTQYDQVLPGEDEHHTSPVIEFGSRMNKDLTSDIEYFLDYTVKFVDEQSGAALHHLETGLDIELISDFDLTIKFIVDRIEKPTPDENGIFPEKDDHVLVVGVTYSF